MNEIKLHYKQIEAIAACRDDNIKSLFITSEGGCGKSEIIKIFTSELDSKDFVCLAPTQSAADNINGETLHSFFKIRPVINTMADKEEDLLSFNLDDIDSDVVKGKIIIIDEASMLGDIMLKGVLERITPKKLILLGDHSQLKPIKDKQVDWSKFCQVTILLTHNYRINDPLVKEIVSNYRERKKLIASTPTISNIKELIFDPETIYIAHTNKSLSNLQSKLLGYSNARIGDILLTFGGCDKNISRLVTKKGKPVLVNYFNNNDLVRVENVKQYENHKLWFCSIVRADGLRPDFNKYGTPPTVIVGDFDEYNKLLKVRFAKARDFQKAMMKKYKVTNATAFKHAAKNKLEGNDDVNKFTDNWREYFMIKNCAYARHQNFRTVYKMQGKAAKHVVVDWKDLPGEDSKYVAISRAKSSITIIK
jgi:hypothetical protein